MSIRRTRQDKIEAQLKRNELTYTLSTETPAQASSTPTAHTSTQAKQHLFGYPVNLIYRDLVKTILVTVIILICFGVIYWQLNVG